MTLKKPTFFKKHANLMEIIINGYNVFGKSYFLKCFIKDFLNGASDCIHETIWATYILLQKMESNTFI